MEKQKDFTQQIQVKSQEVEVGRVAHTNLEATMFFNLFLHTF